MESKHINTPMPGLSKEEEEKRIRASIVDYIDMLKGLLDKPGSIKNVLVGVRYDDDDEQYDDIRAIGMQTGTMQIADTYVTEAFFAGLHRIAAGQSEEHRVAIYGLALDRLRTSVELGTVGFDTVERCMKTVKAECPESLDSEEGVMLMLTTLARIKASSGEDVSDIADVIAVGAPDKSRSTKPRDDDDDSEQFGVRVK